MKCKNKILLVMLNRMNLIVSVISRFQQHIFEKLEQNVCVGVLVSMGRDTGPSVKAPLMLKVKADCCQPRHISSPCLL